MVGGDQLGHLQPDDGGDPHDVKKVFAAGVKVVAFGQQYKRGFASASKKVGDVIAHKNHLFLEKIL